MRHHSLKTEEVHMWYVEPTFDAAHRAVLSGGKPLIYVCPPAGWCLGPLFKQLGTSDALTLILVPDSTDALDVARVAQAQEPGYVHALTGVARTARLLRSKEIRTLVGTTADIAQMIRNSDISLESVGRVIVAWPENHADPEALDPVLAEVQSAHRIIVTTDALSIEELVTRHAHRAPVLTFAGLPSNPDREIRFVAAGARPQIGILNLVLDHLADEPFITVWDPADAKHKNYDLPPGVTPAGEAPPETGLVIFTELPSWSILVRIPAAVAIVVIVRPGQLPYLQKIAELKRPIKISSEYDRGRHKIVQMRKRLRDLADRHDYWLEMSAIEPLLDEFDPAQLAAAALHGISIAVPPAEGSTWTRIRVNVGTNDRARPGDIMGLLLNVVGLKKTDVGRIDMREGFTLVEIQPGDAERATRGLTGQSIRGTRIAARPDRK
jgi:hypothetical protein